MSTTSPIFSLVLATTADTVNVVTQIANNFSSLDSILGVVHTGTGSLKSGLTVQQPTIVSPTMSGVVGGQFSITASTGQFNTVTATGGLLTLNSFTIGTYAYPTTLGSVNQVLTVVTGNAVWVTNPGGTGAGVALDNLASVAINTSLGTFTAGQVTVAKVIATSGLLTGLTSFQATTGTFAGVLTALGTINANVLNVTGGAATFGGVTVGTWALPGTIAATGVLRVLSNTATWYAPVIMAQTAFFCYNVVDTQVATTANGRIPFTAAVYDNGSNVTTGAFTAPASGIYEFNFGVLVQKGGTLTANVSIGILVSATAYSFMVPNGGPLTASGYYPWHGSVISTVASGAVVSVFGNNAASSAAGAVSITTAGGASYFSGKRLYEF